MLCGRRSSSPGDPRAGHVLGAILRFYGWNLRPLATKGLATAQLPRQAWVACGDSSHWHLALPQGTGLEDSWGELSLSQGYHRQLAYLLSSRDGETSTFHGPREAEIQMLPGAHGLEVSGA